MSKFINKLIQIITIIIIILLALFELPQLFKIKPFIVLSSSMEPVLMTGSCAFVDEKIQEANINDIVTYRNGNVIVTHRIIDITDKGYITKGDANDVNDLKIVTKDDLVGKVIFSIPRLGYFLDSLNTKTILIIFIWIIILNLGSFIMSENIKKA